MKTKNTTRKIGVLLLLTAAAISACKKERSGPDEQPAAEYKYLRVLVADQNSTKLSLIEPGASKISTFDAKFAAPSLYATASGRFTVVVHGTANAVEAFDSGLEWHTDHADVAGAAKWAAITANGMKPTHFKTKGDESLIFNDGDGTLSAAKDADFNTAGAKFRTINAGLLPHHGAMAQFANGNYAVTEAITSGASPTQVKVIDKNGATVHNAALQVGALHGNASDGQSAVFGAYTTTANTAGGALVVTQSGQQRMIANPDGFGATRLGTILYAESAKKFVGYSAAKGAYIIDIVTNKMSPIYTGADSYQCKVDYSGRNLLILTLDGKLRIYDLSTGALKKEGSTIAAVNSSANPKPFLEASSRYAYIAMPADGEVLQVDLTDFSKVSRHKVSASPVRLAIFGFETDKGHD